MAGVRLTTWLSPFKKVGDVDDDGAGSGVGAFAVCLYIKFRRDRVHIGIPHRLGDGLTGVCGYVDDGQHVEENRVIVGPFSQRIVWTLTCSPP